MNLESNEQEQPKKPGHLDRLKEQMYSRFKQPLQHPRRELDALENDAQTDWVRESSISKETHNVSDPSYVSAQPQETSQQEATLQEAVGEHYTASEAPAASTEEGVALDAEGKAPRSLLQPKSFFARYSLPTLFLLISILIFTVAGGAAVVYFLTGSNTVTSRKIDVLTNGPRTLKGGEELELQIVVRNNNTAALELADLLVTYPEGTREPSDIGTSLEAQRIPLGVIGPGGTRNGTVRAVLFGKTNESKEITVELEYRLANSSGLFSTDPVTYSVALSSSALDIAFSTNSQAVAGQRMDIVATITSNAQKTVRDVVVHPTFPFGFSVEKTVPEMDTKQLWELGDMQPGEKRELRIIGTLDGQSGDERTFRLLAGTRLSASSQQVDVVLADFEERIVVERPFLDMALSYNGVAAADFVGTTGEAIPVQLTWRNNLPVGLTDVVIAATLGGSALDQYNVAVDKGFYRSIDSLVLWDKSTTEGALEQVAPGETGTLAVRITPKKKAQLAGVENPTITLELHAAGQRLSESDVPQSIQASVKESIKVATDAAFSSSALYFDNPLGSVGPLPPKVNNETTYGILWELENSTSALEDVAITATLPPYTRWIGSVSPAAEQVVFNENDRTVTWRVGKVLPNTGVGTTAPRRVVFAIGLVPSTTQVGEAPALIGQQMVRGRDAFTGKEITKSVADVTTALHESRFADYYGLVTQ